MGLDVVGLVLNVEDEFDVRLPDDEWGGIRTVGDLHRYVLRARGIDAGGRRRVSCLNPAGFVRIRRVLMAQFGLDRCALRPRTRLRDVFPDENRVLAWEDFRARLGLDVPDLVHPGWFRALALFVAALVVSVEQFNLAKLVPAPIFAVLALPLAVLAGCMLYSNYVRMLKLMPGFCVTFAPSVRTIGDLTRLVAMCNVDVLVPDDVGLGSTEADGVWWRLQQIVCLHLAVPLQDVTPDARFIEDLAAD